MFPCGAPGLDWLEPSRGGSVKSAVLLMSGVDSQAAAHKQGTGESFDIEEELFKVQNPGKAMLLPN